MEGGHGQNKPYGVRAKKGNKDPLQLLFPHKFSSSRRRMVEHKISSLLATPLPLFFGMLSSRPLVEPSHQPILWWWLVISRSWRIPWEWTWSECSFGSYGQREIIEPLAEKSGTTHSYMILFCKYQPLGANLQNYFELFS